jgi:RNA polymerase-binding transcription factor DksA
VSNATHASIESTHSILERRLRELLERSEQQLIELEHGLTGLLNDRDTIEEDRLNTRMVVDAIRSDVRRTAQALARLDQGTYGRCTGCGAAIASARLEAVPFIEHCTSCA